MQGYYLAMAADDDCVKLWDLRKLKNLKTLQLVEGYEVIFSSLEFQPPINVFFYAPGEGPGDMCFDSSGTYFAVAGSDANSAMR